MFARIAHPSLHRCRRDTHELRSLTDRLLMVVGEVDDLAVNRRQYGKAATKKFAPVLKLDLHFWGVSGVDGPSRDFLADVFLDPHPQGGERLEVRSAQKPSRNRRAPLE